MSLNEEWRKRLAEAELANKENPTPESRGVEAYSQNLHGLGHLRQEAAGKFRKVPDVAIVTQ